ncbi:GtrA family protein [Clostridia bacterium]|nr:GtrA family protein [Clostridia bacterium]
MKKWIHYSSYLVIGGLTTLLNLIVYKALLVLGVDYRIAVSIAVALSILFAFAFNRKYVFASRGNFKKEMFLFFLARAFAFLVNYIGLVLLVEKAQVDEFWGQVLMNVIVIIVNYILSRFLVFEKMVFSDGKDDNHE